MKPVAWRYENRNVKGVWYITWTEPPDEFNKRPLYEHQPETTTEIAALRDQVKVLRNSLASVLATRKAEAIASMTLDNSEENFIDARIEEKAFFKALNAASNAEKLAREALVATEQKP